MLFRLMCLKEKKMYGIYFWNKSAKKALSVVTLITLLIIRYIIAGIIRVYYRALSRVTGRMSACVRACVRACVLYILNSITLPVFFYFETGRGLVKKKIGSGLVKTKKIFRC
jgi:hypothetical protein